jgi:hypothetical protein
MINQLTKLTLNLLKTNLSLVLIFYASGFLSFLAYYRVLGLPYITGDLQTYAEMAGKNLLFFLQTFIFLATKPSYLSSIIQDIRWAGDAIYSWLIAITLVIIMQLLFKLLAQKSIVNSIQQHRITIFTQSFLMVIVVVSTFYVETQPLYAKNILQASLSDSANFYEQKQNILRYEKEIKKIYYDKRIKTSKLLNRVKDKSSFILNSNSKKSDFIKNFFFSIPESYDESGNDEKRLNALMLIILILTITTIVLIINHQNIVIKWLIFFFTSAQVILIPFNYGILGTNYQYPVVSLIYTEKDNKAKEIILHKVGVFLLAKSQENLIIYDRVNFFQISYIPQGSVVHLEQTFISSPFSNCSNGEFTPCEIYAINQ